MVSSCLCHLCGRMTLFSSYQSKACHGNTKHSTGNTNCSPQIRFRIASAFPLSEHLSVTLLTAALLSAALLRGCRRQSHRRGPDDVPQAAERSRQAEHDLQLLPVGGLARPGRGQLRQGHPFPGLQRRGDVLRQQPLHPRLGRWLCSKSPFVFAPFGFCRQQPFHPVFLSFK